MGIREAASVRGRRHAAGVPRQEPMRTERFGYWKRERVATCDSIGGRRVSGHGRRLAPGVRFFHGLVFELAPNRFDCVIISEVLEHLDAPEILLSMALPFLADSGLLIVTVPNGYGGFELDRRSYQALHADKMVGWLRSVNKNTQCTGSVAGSDDDSPHVQRFTLSRLRRMFEQNNLMLVEARGTSVVSGPFIAHLFGKFERFIRMNASIADHLPLPFVAGWMFCLRFAR
jgi:SAM-dependent methyltransferase